MMPPPEPRPAEAPPGGPSAVRRYGLALVAAGAALLLLRHQPMLHPSMFLLLSLSVMVAASYGGFAAGLVATGTASVGASFLLLEPIGSLAVAGFENQLNLLLFVLVALGASSLGEAMYATRQRAEASARQAERLATDKTELHEELERARHESQAVEQRFQEMLDSVDAVVWEADPQTFRFSFVSRRAEAILGYPLEQWEEPGFWAGIIHPEDRTKTVSQRHQAAEEGRDHKAEYRALAADGKMVWLEDIVYVVRGPDGTPRSLRGLMVDITERRRSQEGLRLREARMRAVLDSALDAVVGMDAEGRVTAWNPRAEAIFGWPREEAVGRPVADLIIPPALREQHWRGLEHFLAGGEGRILDRRIEMPGLRRDGSEVPLEMSLTAAREGDSWTFNAFLADITERKRAEEQLRHQLAFTSAITAHLGEGVYALDREGRLTFMNPAAERMLGWRESELLGEFMHDRVHFQRLDGTRVPPTESPLLGVMDSGTTVEIEDDVFTRRNGTMFPVSYTSSPIVTEGRVVGAVLAFHDVTERKEEERKRAELLAREREAREEAEAASHTKDEFLATLSHELRTPLNAIVGWAHLLRTGQLDEATAARAVETIDRNAKAQSQLISDILDVSRIVTGKLRLGMEPIQPASVMEAALETVRPAAEAKGIRLEAALDAGAGPILADPHRLQQVVWNLLTNAIKFTPNGGSVRVRLARADSHVEIGVEDTGSGMGPDLLPHVFERFRQGDSSSTRRHGGLGLGLSIVKHLVEAHGGTVEAASAEGQGASFTVKLPLLSASRTEGALRAGAMGAPAVGGTAGRVPGLEGVRVLLVDDDPDARELMATVLVQRGAEVTGAGSAAEAMEALRRNLPDVILSDIEMPDEDGHSFIRKVRALPPDRGGVVPAAALTAYARSEDRMQTLLSGFQMHVAKPVDPEELAAVVASLAGRTRP